MKKYVLNADEWQKVFDNKTWSFKGIANSY